MFVRATMVKVACLLAAMTWCAGTADAADAVKLGLDWTVDGYHAPFYLGLDRGYYAENGIDLTIDQGKGSALAVQLVGTGANTFAFADGAAATKLIATGVPVKMVMGIVKKTMMSVVVAVDSSILKPADLKGKKISVSPGDANGLLLPAFLVANNIPVTDVQLVSVDPSAKYRLLAQRAVDAVAGYGVLAEWTMAKLGTKTRHFDYADIGIQVPAFGIVASDKTIAETPDLVRRFVAATSKSWEAAQADPAAATDAIVKHFPQLQDYKDNYRGKLIAVMSYINTSRTMGKPFGWMSREDWKATDAILRKYMGLAPQSSVDVYYTDQFVGH